MSEIKWPCNACRNIEICQYESSWHMGGENWFCPVLRKYVDQDSINSHKEARGMREDIRDNTSSAQYLQSIHEVVTSRDDRMVEASESIREMPDHTNGELRLKAVASMSFFGIHQKKIAAILSIPDRTFRKMFRGK